ncbi:MAG: hypothetical protein ACKJSK_15750 [Roseibacillus sp.]
MILRSFRSTRAISPQRAKKFLIEHKHLHRLKRFDELIYESEVLFRIDQHQLPPPRIEVTRSPRRKLDS